MFGCCGLSLKVLKMEGTKVESISRPRNRDENFESSKFADLRMLSTSGRWEYVLADLTQ